MDSYEERGLKKGGDSLHDHLELMKAQLELLDGAQRDESRSRRRSALRPALGRSGGQGQR